MTAAKIDAEIAHAQHVARECAAMMTDAHQTPTRVRSEAELRKRRRRRNAEIERELQTCAWCGGAHEIQHCAAVINALVIDPIDRRRTTCRWPGCRKHREIDRRLSRFTGYCSDHRRAMDRLTDEELARVQYQHHRARDLQKQRADERERERSAEHD